MEAEAQAARVVLLVVVRLLCLRLKSTRMHTESIMGKHRLVVAIGILILEENNILSMASIQKHLSKPRKWHKKKDKDK